MRSSLALLSLFLLGAACGREQPARAAETYPADAHTHAAIARLEAAMAAAPAPTPTTDAAAWHRLGTALQQEIGTLIAGCTMTGAAHDRLHDWLEQLLPAVQSLQDGTDPAALRAAHQQVAMLLREYHEVFPAAR